MNETLWPSVTVWFCGWFVMDGAAPPELINSTLNSVNPKPEAESEALLGRRVNASKLKFVLAASVTTFEMAPQLPPDKEVVISTELLDAAVEAIVKAAHTGKIGDGKIFVSTVERVIRIRTGETNESAL